MLNNRTINCHGDPIINHSPFIINHSAAYAVRLTFVRVAVPEHKPPPASAHPVHPVAQVHAAVVALAQNAAHRTAVNSCEHSCDQRWQRARLVDRSIRCGGCGRWHRHGRGRQQNKTCAK